MASTSSSATSSSAPGPGGAPNPKRSSGHGAGGGGGFNPLRELEARLYRHGVGTGPGTHDALTYVTTPVPKTGIKRTNPYALLGMERPAVVNAVSPTSPSATSSRPVSSPGPGSAFGTASPKPSRRVSVPVEDTMAKRPITPRAHTQPL
ncbi:hypothetical protein M408DRAFT_334062 [Serendipita vermifera MAFF 305830]|uniref:Uncharacterized protein n=1 Tax=Serendipita vermifera MAFF 305830 TaxID=933852 RepID=A0A0C2W153_SERVB|nr:hypothetical protein M408DRAFT_334062 [Serendipita vermifera MAFF 305830]